MSEPKPVKAAKSEKMFEIRIRFWTACMDDDPEKVLPKHGWDSGMLHVTANDTHDLRSIEAVPFHSLARLRKSSLSVAPYIKVIVPGNILPNQTRRPKAAKRPTRWLRLPGNKLLINMNIGRAPSCIGLPLRGRAFLFPRQPLKRASPQKTLRGDVAVFDISDEGRLNPCGLGLLDGS